MLPQNFCRICWRVHKKRTVSQSVRSCLIVPLSPYFQDLAPADFFLFPEVKILTKKSPISDGRGDRRKFDTGPSRHPAKHVPGRIPELEKTLGAVNKERRGVLWMRQIWLSCMWSSKLKTKKVRFLYGLPSYVSLMYELKNKIGKIFTSKFVGTEPSSYEKKYLLGRGLTKIEKHCPRSNGNLFPLASISDPESRKWGKMQDYLWCRDTSRESTEEKKII